MITGFGLTVGRPVVSGRGDVVHTTSPIFDVYESARNDHRIDGAQSTPRSLTSLPRRFVPGGAVGVGWVLSRARIQHLRLFFPRVDLLLCRWSAADRRRAGPDCSHCRRRTPRCTCAFLSEHGNLPCVHIVAHVLQLGKHHADPTGWPTRTGKSRS